MKRCFLSKFEKHNCSFKPKIKTLKLKLGCRVSSKSADSLRNNPTTRREDAGTWRDDDRFAS